MRSYGSVASRLRYRMSAPLLVRVMSVHARKVSSASIQLLVHNLFASSLSERFHIRESEQCNSPKPLRDVRVGLQLLTKAFKLDELSTADIASHFIKPVTEVPSTNFIHALVDGDLDFEGLPSSVCPTLSTDLCVMLAGPKGREVGESGELDKAVREGEGFLGVLSAPLPLWAQESSRCETTRALVAPVFNPRIEYGRQGFESSRTCGRATCDPPCSSDP
eukprot:1184112-Prorocentrum_minimum.AAC.1